MLIPGHGTALAGPLAAMQLAGNANVEQLQRSLAALAMATQRPAINPGYVTGVVDDRTMNALQAAMGLLTETLGSWEYLALQAAMAGGAATSTAKKAVETYAPQLVVAVNTAAVKFKVATPPAYPIQTPSWLSQFFAPGWYTRPPGMIFLAVVGFVVYKKFLQKPEGATKAAS